MQTGILFDIQRCSMNDGPGLRTTVFLKGCPLRCLWCHNPESQSPKPELLYNYEKCIGCGKCAQVCGCHSFADGSHRIDRTRCTSCGKCADACPVHALEIKGRIAAADEIITEVIKDIKFYRKSGGGVTISGGEPLMQHAFLKELLLKCRGHGIHTAVETSGFASKAVLNEILPLTDLFLWDCKITDARRSKEALGADLPVIMENLDFVMTQGAKVILRCPIIPTINDTAEHLAAITALSHRYAFEGIDILPYHNMGVFKSKELGRSPWDEGFANLSEEKKKWIGDVLTAQGCERFQIL